MRLIDADALKCEKFYSHERHENCVSVYAIDMMPTIEPERPSGEWIPCSERLPKDDDYKPYLNYTEAVWFCTSDGAIGIGWYYKSTNEWEAFGDVVLRGKVVAWMPLPEPYEVKNNDK